MPFPPKKVVSFFKTTLAQPLAVGDTTMNLAAVPTGNIEYPTYVEIEATSGNRELIGLPTAPTGTVYSGIIRNIDPTLDTDAAQTGIPHAANVDVIIAPNHRYHNFWVEVVRGDSAFLGVPKNPATRVISDPRHLVDQEYALGLTLSAVPSFLVTKNGASPSLTVNVAAGEYIKADATNALFAGASVQAVVAATTNYVEFIPSTGLVSVNQTAFTAGRFPLAIVVTSGSDITSVSDRRPWLTMNDGSVDQVRTWATVQTFPAADLQLNTDPSGANDACRKLYVDGATGVIGGLLTTGEAINGTTTPQVVALRASDSLVMKAKANDATLTCAIGFITSNALITTTPNIVTTGLVGGFTGLTSGRMYYVQDTAGTIGLAPSTTCKIPVGKAIGTTRLLLGFGSRVATGTITHASAPPGNQDVVTTIGFRPSVVLLGVVGQVTGSSAANARAMLAYFGTTQLIAGGFSEDVNAAGALTQSNVTTLVAAQNGGVGAYARNTGAASSSAVWSLLSISDTGFTTRSANTGIFGSSNALATITYIAIE